MKPQGGYTGSGRVFLIWLALILSGCIADPVPTESTDAHVTAASGVLVVNEGVWGRDNATLTLYDPVKGIAVQDFFTKRNPGMRIGDTGNSILIREGKAYVVVSASASIEILDPASGTSLGRIRVPEGTQPRHLVLINDSTGFVTNLYDDSVLEVNLRRLTTGRRFQVGPAPEGIAYAYGRLFVANSGLGRFRKDEPKAGTLSVLDPATGSEEGVVAVGNNPAAVIFSRSAGKLYVLTRAFVPDTTGGAVVEVDPVTLQTERRWNVRGAVEMVLDGPGNLLYVVGSDELLRINIAAAETAPVPIMKKESWKGMIAYSMGVSPFTGEVYLGLAAVDYSTPGEVWILEGDGGVEAIFSCGINPGDFGFY